MDGTRIIDSSYEINEYKPYRANAMTTVRIMRADPSCGTPWSRNLGRHAGLWSGLISGWLWLSCSLWVGIWILIVRCLVGVEHLNYACHPYKIITKFVCFAHSIWALTAVRRGRGVGTDGPW